MSSEKSQETNDDNYELEDRSIMLSTPDSTLMGNSLFIYKAFKNILSRCINDGTQFVMIKLTRNYKDGGPDIIDFMFWDIINSGMADFRDEIMELYSMSNLNHFTVTTTTSEGEITIENQEDFYCCLLLYLKGWCYDTKLEKPMDIKIIKNVNFAPFSNKVFH